MAFLQSALRRQTLDPGPIDGLFGEQTRLAVIAFQKNFGLVPDGIVGPKTQAGLMPWYTGYLRHTVTRGDTFYRLARRYQTSPQAIAVANPLLSPNRLPIGQVLVVPLGFPVVAEDVPISSEIVSIYIRGLCARYPFLHTQIIGTSEMGKPIECISIGKGSTEVFFNGAHHANEWITALLLLKFCEEYAAAIASGGEIDGQNATALFARTTLYTIPLVNPDGVDLVTGALTGGTDYEAAEKIAEDFPAIPFPDGWKANIRGVDPNLSYPAGWEQAKSIKFSQGYDRPAPRDYVGSGPLDASESRAVYDFTRMHNFRITLSYHTQGEVIFWQFLDIIPPRAESIGEALAEASGYELAETPYASSFAGYKDWFLQAYRRPSYTVEAGLGENPLPLREFPKLYEQNVGLMTTALILAD